MTPSYNARLMTSSSHKPQLAVQNQPVASTTGFPLQSGAPSRKCADILAKVADGVELGLDDVSFLLASRGPDFVAVSRAADALRKREVGEEVTFVINRNINYTNVCTCRCQFCAFSKGMGYIEGAAVNLSDLLFCLLLFFTIFIVVQYCKGKYTSTRFYHQQQCSSCVDYFSDNINKRKAEGQKQNVECFVMKFEIKVCNQFEQLQNLV